MSDHLEHGVFAVDQEARTIRGLLIPWGVRSRTSASKTKPIIFPRGAVSYPADPSVVGLNRQHDRFDPIGRAVQLEDTESGLVAVFAIARTDEGTAWLADRGDLVKLSAELRDIVRTGELGAAKLTGAALVDEPAFEGAGLFSVDPEPDEEPDEDEPDEEEDEPDETTAPMDVPDDEPDEEDEEESEDPTVAEATAPDTMLASRRTKPAAPALDKRGFFAALKQLRSTGEMAALRPYMASMVDADGNGLFALSDIKYDGAGGIAADAQLPNAWLGELWQGRRASRTIVPLLSQGTLTGIAADGWIWGTKPTMAAWAGNKTAVPSNTPTVAPKQFFSQRFAGGHDLGREYYDFNQTEFIQSYVQAMVDSYAILSDGHALTELVNGATPFTPVAATENQGLMAIVDGALAVVAAQATPSFAVVHPTVFRDVLSTPHSSALEYFDAAVGIDSASSSGFTILPDSRLAAGQVVVGAREAATAWELPGVPIRVSALDLVKGGVDEAFFGYIAVGVTYPAAVVKATITITAAAAAAAKK